MRTPIMDWDSQEPWQAGIVWWSRLDGRYQIEVQRLSEPQLTPDGVEVPDDAYRGTLCIFDRQQDDQLIHEEPVPIAYGAPFGADISDVAVWQQKALEVIDGEHPAQT